MRPRRVAAQCFQPDVRCSGADSGAAIHAELLIRPQHTAFHCAAPVRGARRVGTGNIGRTSESCHCETHAGLQLVRSSQSNDNSTGLRASWISARACVAILLSSAAPVCVARSACSSSTQSIGGCSRIETPWHHPHVRTRYRYGSRPIVASSAGKMSDYTRPPSGYEVARYTMSCTFFCCRRSGTLSSR